MSREEELERAQEEEQPGPSDLESALIGEQLGDAIGHPAVIVGAGASLAEAIAAMQQERRSCVLVVSGDKLAGIFTERDVLLKVAGLAIDTVGRSPGGCTDNVHTVSEALWVTMPGSSIKTLHDLKGKCLNFTNPQSMPVSPRN